VNAALVTPPDREDAWSAAHGRWDVYYAVVFTVVLVVIWLSTTTPQRLVAIPATVAMIPWYLLVGRPIWIRCAGPGWRRAVYIAGMFILFAAA
jgi:hypothetical protein